MKPYDMCCLYCAARETIATHFTALCLDVLCKKPKTSIKAPNIQVRKWARNVPDKRRRSHNLTKNFQKYFKEEGSSEIGTEEIRLHYFHVSWRGIKP